MVSPAVLSALERKLRALAGEVATGDHGLGDHGLRDVDHGLTEATAAFWMDITTAHTIDEELKQLIPDGLRSLETTLNVLADVKSGRATERVLFQRLLVAQSQIHMAASRRRAIEDAGDVISAIEGLLKRWNQAKKERRNTLASIASDERFDSLMKFANAALEGYECSVEKQALSKTAMGSTLLVQPPDIINRAMPKDEQLAEYMTQLQEGVDRVRATRLRGSLGVIYDAKTSVVIERPMREIGWLIEGFRTEASQRKCKCGTGSDPCCECCTTHTDSA